MLGDVEVLTNASFVSSLDLAGAVFDVERMRSHYAEHRHATARHNWNLEPFALARFIRDAPEQPEAAHREMALAANSPMP